MCIIVTSPENEQLDLDIAENCVNQNSDGTGVIWMDTGKVSKTMSKKKSLRWLMSKRPFIAHCRYATVGKVNKGNVQPFKTKCGQYLIAMNGTINGFTDCENSDTKQLVELLDYMNPQHWKAFLSKFEARFLIYNIKQKTYVTTGEWHEKDNFLFSNDRMFDDYYSYGYDNYSTTTKGQTLIAVYGTLKAGFHNHHYLKDSNFVDYGWTDDKYRLCVHGLPFLIKNNHDHGDFVDVEVYSVDNNTLDDIDSLEGHPNFYERKQIDICLLGGRTVKAWVYFVDDTYDDGTYYRSFVNSRSSFDYDLMEEEMWISSKTTQNKNTLLLPSM